MLRRKKRCDWAGRSEDVRLRDATEKFERDRGRVRWRACRRGIARRRDAIVSRDASAIGTGDARGSIAERVWEPCGTGGKMRLVWDGTLT